MVAFAIIGLVLAVLITASVASAAVVAGDRPVRRAPATRLPPGPGRVVVLPPRPADLTSHP